jgi:hypothetical protein
MSEHERWIYYDLDDGSRWMALPYEEFHEIELRAFEAAAQRIEDLMDTMPAPLFSIRTKGTATDGWLAALRIAAGAVRDG